MRFTERELTVAVDAVARRMFAATRPPWRRKDVEAAWQALPTIDKYNRRSAVGEVVLPALQALPERPTVGAAPEFSDEEYAEAAESASRALLEQRDPGGWEKLSDRDRGRVLKGAVTLTREAVQAMPVRQDPDDLQVPDHL